MQALLNVARWSVARLSVAPINCCLMNCRRLTVARLSVARWSVTEPTGLSECRRITFSKICHVMQKAARMTQLLKTVSSTYLCHTLPNGTVTACCNNISSSFFITGYPLLAIALVSLFCLCPVLMRWKHGSCLPVGRRLSAGLRQRSSSAALCLH